MEEGKIFFQIQHNLSIFCLEGSELYRQTHFRLSRTVNNHTLRRPLLDDVEEADETTSKHPKVVTVDDTFLRNTKFIPAFFNGKNLHLFVMIFLSASYPYFITTYFKTYGGQFIRDDQFISMAGAFGALFNALGRLTWASLFDIFGFKVMYSVLLLIEIVVASTLLFVQSTRELYLVWVCMSFFILGCHKPLFMTVPAQLYGPKMGGIIYSLIFCAYPLSTVFDWVVQREVSLDRLSYQSLFYILAAMAGLSLILNFFFKEVPKDPEIVFPDPNKPRYACVI